MAKHSDPQSQADDTSAGAPARPRARRASSAQAPASSPTDSIVRSNSIGSSPSEEEIRMRAYERYLARGGAHGMDFEDWLEAERELKTK
jgi:hypothetical protein